MSKIENLKSKIGQFFLNKKLKKIKRRVIAHNLKTASTAGILFSSLDDESFNIVKEFLSFLSQNDIKVVALGYIPAKKIPEQYLMRKGFNFYCKKDVNWYQKPDNEIVNDFINKKFDILFDLSIQRHFTINYIGSLSKASFKVGKFSINSYEDLSIDISKNNSIGYLIEQIKHYLNLINN